MSIPIKCQTVSFILAEDKPIPPLCLAHKDMPQIEHFYKRIAAGVMAEFKLAGKLFTAREIGLETATGMQPLFYSGDKLTPESILDYYNKAKIRQMVFGRAKKKIERERWYATHAEDVPFPGDIKKPKASTEVAQPTLGGIAPTRKHNKRAPGGLPKPIGTYPEGVTVEFIDAEIYRQASWRAWLTTGLKSDLAQLTPALAFSIKVGEANVQEALDVIRSVVRQMPWYRANGVGTNVKQVHYEVESGIIVITRLK